LYALVDESVMVIARWRVASLGEAIPSEKYAFASPFFDGTTSGNGGD